MFGPSGSSALGVFDANSCLSRRSERPNFSAFRAVMTKLVA